MLNEINIENFKAIKNLRLEDFRKLNIFVGKPNSGKTSALEAIAIFLARNPNMLTLLLHNRNMIGDNTCFESLFYDYDIDKSIILENKQYQLIIKPKLENTNMIISNEDNLIVSTDSYRIINSLEFLLKQNKKENVSSASFNQKKYNGAITTQYQITAQRETIKDLNGVEFIGGLNNTEYSKKFRLALSNIINSDIKKKKHYKNKSKNLLQI